MKEVAIMPEQPDVVRLLWERMEKLSVQQEKISVTLAKLEQRLQVLEELLESFKSCGQTIQFADDLRKLTSSIVFKVLTMIGLGIFALWGYIVIWNFLNRGR